MALDYTAHTWGQLEELECQVLISTWKGKRILQTSATFFFSFKTVSQSPGWSSVHLVIQVDLELPIPPWVLGLQVNVISLQGQVVYLLSMLGIHQANICQLSYASSLLHLLMCVSAFMKPGWYCYLFPEVDDEGESNLGFWGDPNY